MELNLKLTRGAMRNMEIGDSIVVNNRNTNIAYIDFHKVGMKVDTQRGNLIVNNEITPIICLSFVAIANQEKYDAFMNPKPGGRKHGQKLGKYKPRASKASPELLKSLDILMGEKGKCR